MWYFSDSPHLFFFVSYSWIVNLVPSLVNVAVLNILILRYISNECIRAGLLWSGLWTFFLVSRVLHVLFNIFFLCSSFIAAAFMLCQCYTNSFCTIIFSEYISSAWTCFLSLSLHCGCTYKIQISVEWYSFLSCVELLPFRPRTQLRGGKKKNVSFHSWLFPLFLKKK